MKIRKILSAVFISLFLLSFCFGQDDTETVTGGSWVNQYGIYPEVVMTFRYDRYSRKDTQRFLEKLDLIKKADASDEWNGIYSVGHEETVNYSQIRLNTKVGYIDFYIYACFPELRYLNFGKVVNKSDSIELVPEIVENSPRKLTTEKYVKVRWGNKYLLVGESSLSAFAEKAVGIYVQPADDSNEERSNWMNFWVKDDSESDFYKRKFTGLPEFPLSYKKFQRLPVETKIISVSSRTIDEPESLGQAIQALYAVTIGAGKDKGVKVGMKFEIPEINESLEITQISSKSAIGVISRSVNEDKSDQCFGDNPDTVDPIPCPKIKKDLKIKTEIGNFWL